MRLIARTTAGLSKSFALLLPILFLTGMAPETKAPPVALSEEQLDKLSKLIKGRVPEKPVRCLFNRDTVNMMIISENILLYGSSRNAKRIYLNRTSNACQGIADNRIVSQKSSSSKLCKGDTLIMSDYVANLPKGSCRLNAFVPMVKQ